MFYSVISLDTGNLEHLQDNSTDSRLLPAHLRRPDNSHRMRHSKAAVNNAINNCLTPLQKSCVTLYYGQGLSKSEIAARQGTCCSTVSKTLKSAQGKIRDYVELYLQVYDMMRKEWDEGLWDD